MRPCVVTCVLIVPLLSGCIGWVPNLDGKLLEGRAHLDEGWPLTMQEGVTSRAEVLLNIGEPEATLDVDRIFVYLWTPVTGHVFWIVPYGYSAGGDSYPTSDTEALILQFDEGGLLERRVFADPDGDEIFELSRFVADALECAKDEDR